MQSGLIQIYTGDGKGKTTAALGLALRASGAGLKIFIGQFIKKGDYSEIRALRRLKPHVVLRQYGRGRFVKGKPSPDDITSARQGLAALTRALVSKKYNVVIADEIFCAVSCRAINKTEVKRLLDKKPSCVELVLTGRNAPASIMKRADLITEMRKIRHPFDRGEPGRRGIEF